MTRELTAHSAAAGGALDLVWQISNDDTSASVALDGLGVLSEARPAHEQTLSLAHKQLPLLAEEVEQSHRERGRSVPRIRCALDLVPQQVRKDHKTY